MLAGVTVPRGDAGTRVVTDVPEQMIAVTRVVTGGTESSLVIASTRAEHQVVTGVPKIVRESYGRRTIRVATRFLLQWSRCAVRAVGDSGRRTGADAPCELSETLDDPCELCELSAVFCSVRGDSSSFSTASAKGDLARSGTNGQTNGQTN